MTSAMMSAEFTLDEPVAETRDLLGDFFAAFLDESAFGEFRKIERLFAALQEQGTTRSGYPLIRPADCGQMTRSLEELFQQSQPRFRAADPRLTDRFETLIANFHEFCRNIYPTEAVGALILHCRVLLFMNRPEQVVALASPLALRPYAVIDNIGHCHDLVRLFGQAHLMLGTLAQVPISFIAFGAWLSSLPKGPSVLSIGPAMAPFVSRQQSAQGFRAALIAFASIRYLRAAREHRGVLPNLLQRLRLGMLRLMLAAGYFLLKTAPAKRAPFSLKMNPAGGVLVTRAMGGIGDLLMMIPGLEAISAATGRPVDFALPRKFFAVLKDNPHVRLIDIDGPPIDVSQYRRFANLSICPAGCYESSKRPNVKRGRVELFARAIGVSRERLIAQGWHINQYIGPELQARAKQFLEQAGLGERRLIGLQPYSRDSYKDHPEIEAITTALARDYDVLVFHHTDKGLPSGAGIASTAGLPLDLSLALVQQIEAMVCVDSAFLHAAAAHDIPVVALFGPTDARTFTRHHNRVEILWKQQEMGCVPCWRNEDLPCRITGLLAVSPCMAAIQIGEVRQAVSRALEPGRLS